MRRSGSSGKASGHVLVTGASSGLGAELAKTFARKGFRPILTARNEARLREVQAAIERAYHVRASVIPKDLAEPAAPAELFSQLADAGVVVSALVNNAGFNVHGPFLETDLERELAMLRVQVSGVTHLTKLFLRQLPATERGLLLNVASVAAMVPGPLVSVHFASRAFTLRFSEALAHELRDAGIRVTCLCPGPMRSAFFERAGMTRVRLAGGRPIPLMEPATVAEVGFRALERGEPVVVPGAPNRGLAILSRLVPRSVVLRATGWLMERVETGEAV